MATQPLPDRIDLDQLRRRARELQRQANAGVAEARAWLERQVQVEETATVPLHLVQLAIARSWGFSRWPVLIAHAGELRAATRDPMRAADAEAGADDPVQGFLRHAVLLYGPADGPDRRATARRLLAEQPDLATQDIYAAAALTDHRALSGHLARDPESSRREGGPFGWPPLLYLAYARVHTDRPPADAERSVRVLLAAGADPNAGFLWRGQPPPFTALTGLFGGGEQGDIAQPAHPYAAPLARLLLEAGADPNDGQTLYNKMFTEDDGHLELLFDHGLGRGDGGPWKRRLGRLLDTPEEMLRAQLTWAITHGFDRRVRLLAGQGLDLAAPLTSSWLPHRHRETPVGLAWRSGEAAIADLLIELGAPVELPDAETRLLAALLSGDRKEVERLDRDHPGLESSLRRSRPSLVLRATVLDRPEAVTVIASRGFHLDALGRQDAPVEEPWETALHHAAGEGKIEMVRLLVGLGATTDIADRRFGATPLGWAQFFGRSEVAALLEPLTSTPVTPS